ncbi:MAG: TetR/AcrR family transcriptional regulator [Leptospiraceae bacterium]|nr:TetR/AcrR family transcriptional regulator [Leptospiraceae bacterium]
MSHFTVREIKYAKSRLRLLHSLIKELKNKPASEIKIKDLCKKAEISEPSFYNYFPQKDDIFFYFVGLWSIELFLYSQKSKSGLDSIYQFFSYTGKTSELHPYLMKELLAYQARADILSRSKFVQPVTDAEKTITFGSVDGIEKISGDGLRTLIFQSLKKAVDDGELPRATNLDEVSMAVGGIFFGVAGLCASLNFKNLSTHYKNSLEIIFNGLAK